MRLHAVTPTPSRREFLALMAGTGLTVAFTACRSRHLDAARGETGARLDADPSFVAAGHPALVKALPPAIFIRHGLYNAETRLESLPVDSLVTPTASFYVRNHGPTPVIAVETWSLKIVGDGVERPLTLSHDELVAMPGVTLTRYLECAGNGRAYFGELMGKPAEGSPWRDGGYGVAAWTGVPLAALLRRAGLRPEAAWVMPVGLDDQRYARPMPLDKALAADTILAHRMNGVPLPPDHGFPARVVVPGWVGAASVKWVGALVVTARQPLVTMNTEEYVLLGPDYPRPPRPLTTAVVKSAVCLPWPAMLPPGRHVVSGLAWSPFGKVARVEVSVDHGRTFRPAQLVGDNLPVAGTRWQFELDAAPGDMTLTPRAIDEWGNGQPALAEQKWNEKGYLFAAPVPHPLHVG